MKWYWLNGFVCGVVRESWFGWYVIGVLEQTGWIGFKCVVMSVWSDDWTETLSIHSIDRMDSCGVISTLQCFFHHWYHNECIPSLFIHLKEWERQTRSSYPILTLINPIHLYLISLFTHTHWTTVSQTIRWITNQRDAHSNSYTHTHQCDSDRKRESHNTTLHFIDTSPEEWFHQRQHIPSSLQQRVISLQSIR